MKPLNGRGAAKPSRSNRSGNVVTSFSSRLQIDSVSYWVGRHVRHGRSARNCLFALPKSQSTDVNDRENDKCDDQPKYDFHCTLHHRGFLGQRAISGLVALIITPNRSAMKSAYEATLMRHGSRRSDHRPYCVSEATARGTMANCWRLID